MLIGEFTHTIDPKKRLAIPARFRKELGDRGVLTRGLDQCLFLYPMREWETLAQKLGSLPMGQSATRNFVRLLLAGASEVEFDSLGRILIPDYLKGYAGLEKRTTITGVFNRIEIWDSGRWEQYRGEVERNTDALAEKLGEVGLI